MATKAKAKSLTKAPPKKRRVGIVAPTCCDAVCAAVGAGKILIVVCDGTTMKTIAGTQDGQWLRWDNTAKSWVLTTL